MNSNLTDTQKFKLANEIARNIHGQERAYGIHHWEPVQQEERTIKKCGLSYLPLVWAGLLRCCCTLRRLFERR